MSSPSSSPCCSSLEMLLSFANWGIWDAKLRQGKERYSSHSSHRIDARRLTKTREKGGRSSSSPEMFSSNYEKLLSLETYQQTFSNKTSKCSLLIFASSKKVLKNGRMQWVLTLIFSLTACPLFISSILTMLGITCCFQKFFMNLSTSVFETCSFFHGLLLVIFFLGDEKMTHL